MTTPHRLIASAVNGAQLSPGMLPAGDPAPATPRCDRCAAEALVLAEHDAEALAFCGHHYGRYEAALAAAGWEVTRDRRASLASA